MEFDRLGWILLLFLLNALAANAWISSGKQFSPFSSESSVTEVTLQSYSDCESSLPVHIVGEDVSEYHVVMKWKKYNCSSREKGLSCRRTFIQKNNFANIGTRLCVDIQGVQHDIRGMNQLLVTVSDRDGDLKKVYTITRLRPEGEPYYVCSRPNQNSLSISISVRQSVSICPEVLDYLFNNEIRLGTVSARPQSQIVSMDLNRCSVMDIPRNESLLLKVNAEGSLGDCYIRKRLPLPYSYLRGCLTLVHYSNDFRCDVEVRLSSERNVDSDASVSTDRSPGSDMSHCETFSGRNGLPVLSVNVYPVRATACRGQFAVRLDFRQTPPPDRDDDDDEKTSPNLYMAVFITLIAICLVCLALTCLCCIRFRAKRLRRLQRRNHRQVSVPNQGFQYDLTTAPPYDNISWSPTEPGMLFGLPSYDDVVAESSGGINPSGDAYKNELPPAYDSVCSSSDT